MTPSAIVQKLWNYCDVLRHDGMSYNMVADLESALEQLRLIAEDLSEDVLSPDNGAAF